MDKSSRIFILTSTFLVGMCSIIYELLISTVSSYFLGDSVRQFSLIIGFYMAFMGVGSWLSRFIKKHRIGYFIGLELLLGIVGAFSVPLCYIYFSYADFEGYQIFILGLVSVIGVLTGLEIPLLTKIIDESFPENEGLSDVLTLDYLGALAATLVFPFVLIPFMGVYKSSLIFGFINIFIGILNFIVFRKYIRLKQVREILFFTISIAFIAIVALAFLRSDEFVSRWNKGLFKYPVVYESSSAYQNIILTDNGNEFRLYLNGAIQFSSRDEYRYHEGLVHVPAASVPFVKNVLVLGGGEGLAVREILKYPELEHVDVVDLDPAITELASTLAEFKKLNKNAFDDNRVKIYHDDAFRWLLDHKNKYDLIVADLPDPNNESLSKLYSVAFYQMVLEQLKPGGVFCTQATGPDLSPLAFWSVEKSIEEAGLKHVKPFQINIPSFGNWGFVMATNQASGFNLSQVRTDIETKFIDSEILPRIFHFSKDIEKKRKIVEGNHLDRPIILQYYLKHWRELNEGGKK